ncbi:hypothetical protein HPP92_004315 [Vanilla planifolia]|uniref:Uncharacterized protein n=1 Tax=Vanilla planifolia TaxID=51239 RepID=A0A835RWN0_VANPL|nr:hypothetical protein HPP92_004315 [Vanilla planifolia]
MAGGERDGGSSPSEMGSPECQPCRRRRRYYSLQRRRRDREELMGCSKDDRRGQDDGRGSFARSFHGFQWYRMQRKQGYCHQLFLVPYP